MALSKEYVADLFEKRHNIEKKIIILDEGFAENKKEYLKIRRELLGKISNISSTYDKGAVQDEFKF